MVSQSTKDDYPQVTIRDVLKLPLPNLDLSVAEDNSLHDKVVSLVEVMLGLHKKLAVARTGDATVRLERQIAATDEQIDALVYALYGLTEDEIGIVEGD